MKRMARRLTDTEREARGMPTTAQVAADERSLRMLPMALAMFGDQKTLRFSVGERTYLIQRGEWTDDGRRPDRIVGYLGKTA